MLLKITILYQPVEVGLNTEYILNKYNTPKPPNFIYQVYAIQCHFFHPPNLNSNHKPIANQAVLQVRNHLSEVVAGNKHWRVYLPVII